MPIAMGAGTSERELRDAAESAPSMEGLDLASGVSTKEPYRAAASGESSDAAAMASEVLWSNAGRVPGAVDADDESDAGAARAIDNPFDKGVPESAAS